MWGRGALILAFLAAAAQPTFPSIPGFPTPGSGQPTFTVPPPTGGPAPSSPSMPVIPRSDVVTMKLGADGTLAVTEIVAVPKNATMTRTVALHDQAVRDATVDGAGTVHVTADAMTIKLDGGKATVQYTVTGAVTDARGKPELRWRPVGGWDTDLILARVSLTTPRPPLSVACLSGPEGSTTPCKSVHTDAKAVTRTTQLQLRAGDRIDLTAVLDPGSVKVDTVDTAAATTDDDGTGPFALTWFSGTGLVTLLALLLAGFALLWVLRGRDAKPQAREPVPVLRHEGEHVVFVPPEEILPGRLGTVLDEYVDVKDVSATVVDLAVRGYLLVVHGVAADGSPDWQLVRHRPADADLAGYERVLLDTLLPQGIESASLADLRANPVDLTPVRDALYNDVVARGFFGTRPDDRRSRYSLAGATVAVLGVLVTLVLAFTVGSALIGLAVVLAGLVVLVGARWMPARTGQGSALLGAADDLTAHLSTTVPEQLPAADREPVFARSLPYALVLRQSERWLQVYPESEEGRYWYVAGEQPRPFAVDFQDFNSALDAALAGSGRLRSG
ncbi:DUF2207 family protein [Labedaea rhizosphaerae]|uniref:Putative membrane protein DUF2207 n=1 Tax=Labedaea rhizosphaerae TaxID=598644 RepID=A0A4R6SKP7_LABRH|nr:DUF2207 domain-containing protein [Labedaea rhizosphaerae]TDQ04130.1 putative membrane protein DUF2207 [Labedaea rhizosphaerae]